MEFILSESQLSFLLEQTKDKSKLAQNMKELFSFTNNLVSKISKNFGLNVRMLLTWGTSVGAMVKPLDIWIETGNFGLTEQQKNLLLAGVSMILFYENKRLITKILTKIKEEGLIDTFKVVLNKGEELKKAFFDFVNSLNVTMVSVIDVVAYSFLIPILTDIQVMSMGAKNIEDTTELIVERLLSSGVLVVSAAILSAIVEKIVSRFR